MGFLGVFGLVLKFEESKKYFKIIRDNFVKYVIRELKKKYFCEKPMFGFEFEFHKIKYDKENKTVKIDLSAQYEIIESMKENKKEQFHLSHEYGGWMYEVVPDTPFDMEDLYGVNKCVNNLFKYLNETYGENVFLSLGSYPLLGVGNYYINEEIKDDDKESDEDEKSKNAKLKFYSDIKNNNLSKSNYLSDIIINRHPRFGNLTRNIRLRRGEKVDVKIPIFKDKNTNLTQPTKDEPYPGYIDMDCMGFGMGCVSLQVTIGCDTLEDCLKVYDQLIPLSPLFLTLSSSTPIHKGKLSEYDNRWLIISKSVDDRTEEERNPKSDKYIYKSRYSPSYSYIGNVNKYYNDYPKFPINEDYYKEFINAGISENLSSHFCNLLVRDPLVVFDKKINITDEQDMSHFESINSSNWNSLRFKLPRPADHDFSYKIEVRTCDLQITPCENISMIHLVMILYHIIIKNLYNFIIPITKVDENYEKAYKIDSINTEKFWWRVNCFDKNSINNINSTDTNFNYEEDGKKNIKLLTINEIFNGCKEYNYPGIINVIREDILKNVTDKNKQNELIKFVDFFERKTKGELWTDAKYIRKFVNDHPKYNKDSIITEEINFDLITHLLDIQNGVIKPKELFG